MFRKSLTAATVALAAVPAFAETCRDDRLDIRQGGLRLTLEISIADDPQERAQGLMWVEEMGQLEGMLFIYQDGGKRRSFWMRNTLIPLDMLFIGADGVVRSIHENAVPLDETPIPSETDDITTVLEVNGGLSAMLGLEAGAEIRHASFGPDAAWPCAE